MHHCFCIWLHHLQCIMICLIHCWTCLALLFFKNCHLSWGCLVWLIAFLESPWMNIYRKNTSWTKTGLVVSLYMCKYLMHSIQTVYFFCRNSEMCKQLTFWNSIRSYTSYSVVLTVCNFSILFGMQLCVPPACFSFFFFLLLPFTPMSHSSYLKQGLMTWPDLLVLSTWNPRECVCVCVCMCVCVCVCVCVCAHIRMRVRLFFIEHYEIPLRLLTKYSTDSSRPNNSSVHHLMKRECFIDVLLDIFRSQREEIKQKS